MYILKILVGISGGVDSAVAAYLLKQQWHDIVWGFMLNYLDELDPGCTTKADLEEFYKVCKFLDIPYEVLDFREEYEEKILNYIYEWYLQWLTPNPDVLCNTEIKFKLFLDEALKLGYDKIATGHYSDNREQIRDNRSVFKLCRARDLSKDQSYFLAGLNQFQLAHALFPLADMLKSEVRKLALEIWLPNAQRKDSQWLCFVGNIAMADFLRKKIGIKPWDIVLAETWDIVWQHEWAYQYTIWQRKGIKLNFQAYVTDIDVVNNLVYVSSSMSDKNLFRESIGLKSLHWIGEEFILPLECKCKVRYRQELQDCRVEQIWSPDASRINQIIIHFKEPQKWVPNGQICVLYGGENYDVVLGCGEISAINLN